MSRAQIPAETPSAERNAASALSNSEVKATDSTTQKVAKKAQNNLLNQIRLYEPNQVGWTKDQGDGGFMDFTVSLMFPLLHGYYPDADKDDAQEPLARLLPHYDHLKFFPYVAATIRAGQYISTRPSSPVVEKRFNPLLAFRCWTFDPHKSGTSLNRYIEVVYAHESNGQSIANPLSFSEQFEVYSHMETNPSTPPAVRRAYLSARDTISRGWDYWGLHAAYDHTWSGYHLTHLAKFDYFLRHGLLQGPQEEYNPWEKDSQGKRRRHTDGLMWRSTVKLGKSSHRFLDIGSLGLTYTTGTQNPFQYNTLKAELGILVRNLPFFVWYRQGYNSDLIDYYRKDQSWGVMVSFWTF